MQEGEGDTTEKRTNELTDVAAYRICDTLGMSQNANTETTCFNGVELPGGSSGAARREMGVLYLWCLVVLGGCLSESLGLVFGV